MYQKEGLCIKDEEFCIQTDCFADVERSDVPTASASATADALRSASGVHPKGQTDHIHPRHARS